MNLRYSKISGWGKCIPEKKLTNFDLEKMVDTTDEWIQQRTGIQARHVVSEGETGSMLAIEAAQKALKVAKLTPEDLDLIIVCTTSPDYLLPAVSSLIQDQLGAKCPAFTLVTGCTGFVYGLVTAHQFIAAGAYNNVLVIGVELISRFLDWTDRNTCVLFGDGAGALVVTPSNTPTGVKAFELGSDGSKGMELAVPGIGCANKIDHAMLDRKEQFIHMNGRAVFKFATRVLPQSTLNVLEKANMTIDDIDLLIPHQANARIIDLAVRRLGIAKEKVFVNLHKYGNTSAASIPIALVEALEEGKIKEGDHLCLVSFGGGLTWASVILQWGQPLKDDKALEKVDESLIWDLTSIRKKVALASTKMRVQTRKFIEETTYKASIVGKQVGKKADLLMLPFYAFGDKKPSKKPSEKDYDEKEKIS